MYSFDYISNQIIHLVNKLIKIVIFGMSYNILKNLLFIKRIEAFKVFISRQILFILYGEFT